MKSIIVAVATPAYPTNATRKDLVTVNKQVRNILTSRFPGAQVVYDGLANGLKKDPAIKFYAKLPADSEVAVALLAANGGKRPTVGKGFAGAFTVTVDANGPVDLEGSSTVTIDLGAVPQAEVVETIASAFGLADSPAVTAGADAPAEVTTDSLDGLSMKALVAIAESKGIKVNATGSKAAAIARILAA